MAKMAKNILVSEVLKNGLRVVLRHEPGRFEPWITMLSATTEVEVTDRGIPGSWNFFPNERDAVEDFENRVVNGKDACVLHVRKCLEPWVTCLEPWVYECRACGRWFDKSCPCGGRRSPTVVRLSEIFFFKGEEVCEGALHTMCPSGA